ncbi:MAG: KTSC domain-containing protein [Pseudohongiellaceae bacterium]
MISQLREHLLEHSNRIVKIQHNGETLRVFLQSGGIYDYEDVSDELVTNLVNTESPDYFIRDKIISDRVAIPVVDGEPFTTSNWS